MMSTPVFLGQRAVIVVSGADAAPFLQGLLTVSTIDVPENETRYGALLTPQGKVIADMILTRTADGFFLDCDAAVAPSLLKRLRMFKLRADVAIEERSDLGVRVFAGVADPRSPHAPLRSVAAHTSTSPDDTDAYHAARIAAGLAEQGADFGAEEVFPADINMDLIGGVDFRKGCFVGQEVVSRMKRRGTARRRTLKAIVPPGLAPGPVLANGFEIGSLTSVSGGAGLARVRIDRLADALAKNEEITVAGRSVALDAPPWLTTELVALAEAKEHR